MNPWYLLLAVLGGCAAAFQSAANGGLTQRVGLGVALVLNTVVVLMATILLYIGQEQKPPTWFPDGTPIYLYLGGLFGFLIIACMATVFPKIGGGYAIALMVLGQGVAALLIDHFGLFGMPRQPLNVSRLFGLVLIVAGVLFMRK